MLRVPGRVAREKSAVPYGFSLTELTIVLAIIGAIAAGIFAAYSATSYRIMVNQGVDEINFIVGNVRSLYAGQSARAAPAVAYGAPGETTLVNQNVFPSEMIRPSNPTVADNPWDQTAANGSAEIEINTPTAGYFTVEYLNVPSDACTDLLVRNSMPGMDSNLVQITVADTTAAISNTYVYTPKTAPPVYQLPITTVVAAASCPYTLPGVPVPLYIIQWTYTLGS